MVFLCIWALKIALMKILIHMNYFFLDENLFEPFTWLLVLPKYKIFIHDNSCCKGAFSIHYDCVTYEIMQQMYELYYRGKGNSCIMTFFFFLKKRGFFGKSLNDSYFIISKYQPVRENEKQHFSRTSTHTV